MKSRVILSALGSDRPGLTQALADAIFAAGGNWLESHLGHLGGKFVGAVLVELDDAAVPALEQAIRAVDARGLHVSIVAAGDEAEPSAGAPLAFEVIGQDRPGIVREVTAVLAGLQVNIEDFSSDTQPSSWSGEPLFRASAKLTIPATTTPDKVQAALEAISGEIMVDFAVVTKLG
jgi:glycine cleavage system regulatory protein